jgi:hypothetical protein
MELIRPRINKILVKIEKCIADNGVHISWYMEPHEIATMLAILYPECEFNYSDVASYLWYCPKDPS